MSTAAKLLPSSHSRPNASLKYANVLQNKHLNRLPGTCDSTPYVAIMRACPPLPTPVLCCTRPLAPLEPHRTGHLQRLRQPAARLPGVSPRLAKRGCLSLMSGPCYGHAVPVAIRPAPGADRTGGPADQVRASVTAGPLHPAASKHVRQGLLLLCIGTAQRAPARQPPADNNVSSGS